MKIPILRLFDKDGREVAIPAIRGRPGPAGDGTGDMVASVYDPTGQAKDIFAYSQMCAAREADRVGRALWDDATSGFAEKDHAHADLMRVIGDLAARVTALEAGEPDEPVNPDVPATYTKVDEFEFNSESDEEGYNYLYFGRDAGWFWGTGIGGVSVGRYVSFSGDATGAKYLVTSVTEEPGLMGDELSVYFSGTYTPEVTDIVTVWERG